jgi:hypothetical protein
MMATDRRADLWDKHKPTSDVGQAQTYLRWLILAPVSVGGGWLAWLITTAINRFSLFAVGIDPNSFIGRAYVEAISAFCMGIGFVYMGARVAPTHQKQTSFALAGVGLLLVSFSVASAMMAPNYLALWADAFAALGAGAAILAINRGEINYS